MADRRIVAIEVKNVEVGEIEEDKKETLNGKNVLSKLEESPKQSKVERK
jgi:hypothetical protein